MYPETIAEILHLNQPNKPGICSVQAVPKDGIVSLWNIADILKWQSLVESYPLNIFYVLLKDGFNWVNISRDFSAQLSFTETEKPDVHLKKFSYTVAFDIPNDVYHPRSHIIQAFDKREWILKVTERTGAVRLIGSLDRGADFSAHLATGSTLKGVNKYTCGFTWETGPERAFYIDLGY